MILLVKLSHHIYIPTLLRILVLISVPRKKVIAGGGGDDWRTNPPHEGESILESPPNHQYISQWMYWLIGRLYWECTFPCLWVNTTVKGSVLWDRMWAELGINWLVLPFALRPWMFFLYQTVKALLKQFFSWPCYRPGLSRAPCINQQKELWTSCRDFV